MALPEGQYFRQLSEAVISDDGDRLHLLIEMVDGSIASIAFPLAELQRRATIVMGVDPAFPSLLH